MSAKSRPKAPVKASEPVLGLLTDSFCLPMRAPEGGIPRMQYHAVRWSKQAAQRYQWAGRDSDRQDSRKAARDLLNELGVSDDHLRQLAQKKLIQVAIPWHAPAARAGWNQILQAEKANWHERIMPWELLLLQGIRYLDNNAHVPCVVRRLCIPGCPDQPAAAASMPSARLVINCPGRDHETQLASFKHERAVLTSHLKGMVPAGIDEYSDWTAADFMKPENTRDDCVHLMAAQDVQGGEGSSNRLRRLWLRHPPGMSVKRLSSEGANTQEWMDFDLAAAVLGRERPRLLALSFEHSGPRLAALAVARGAQAAIGFQDSISEGVRVNFFSRFYEKLALSGGTDLAAAFAAALDSVSPLLRGSGIILWSRHVLVSEFKAPQKDELPSGRKKSTKAAATGQLSQTPSPASTGGTGGQTALESLPQPASALQPPSSPDFAARWLATTQDIRPKPRLNYAMMHNQPSWEKVYPHPNPNGPLFDAFTIRCPPELAWSVDGRRAVAHVRVTLHSGDVSASWSRLVPLERDSTPLARDIRVPLTSVLARTLLESIHTLVDMEILVNGAIVYRKCESVTLLAIDEWQDDGVATFWLPSFVQPRDPAIRDLLRDARHILGALADDFHAAFDGYQSDDPEKTDLQVQAIWAAIMQQWRLAYINPPPSFTAQSQRLRRPGDILAERAGTCIDLALLLAAALEYIDIEPLLILAPGHAYVAYRRQPRAEGSEIFTKNNVTIDTSGLTEEGPGRKTAPAAFSEQDAANDAETPANGERNLPPWAYDQRQHTQIVKALREGSIAALEATYLTRLMPFSAALEEGARKLVRRVDFDCLLDVRSARQCHVTPLPLIYEAG